MSDMAAQTSEHVRLRPITVAEYHRMGETGIIGPAERVQLVGGRIIEMPPIGPRHAYGVTTLDTLLQARFRGRAVVRTQQPVTLDAVSEPEPDLVLAREPEDRYASIRPTAAETLLVIEVSESTLRTDRGEKLIAYAQGGIREYWIVNLVDRTLEIYTDPDGPAFRNKRVARAGEHVAPLAFPNDDIRVDAILPVAAA